jgi:hypothetical protein
MPLRGKDETTIAYDQEGCDYAKTMNRSRLRRTV